MGEPAGGEPRLTPSKARRRYVFALTAVLLVAASLRFAALSQFPPGVEHDEVAEVEIAEGILSGHHAIYFQQAYGQEPLFLYLLAGAIAMVGRNVLALRFVSASVGLLTVAAGARWARRWFGRLEALVTAVGIGVMLWPVFWSRVGLRGMLLPLTMLLGADALWSAWRGRRPLRGAVASGGWFGLSAYTYLAARGVPLLLLGLGLLFALFDRVRFRRRWRSLVLLGLVAATVASPLILYVTRNKSEQTRVYEVNAPLEALLNGDPQPVLANLPKLLGMFSVAGDATERNNLALRPIFVEPVWIALFYLGVLISLIRFRDVRYSGLLVWLGAMSLPSLVTTEAPNFVRTLGALPAVMALPGVAAAFMLPLLQRAGALWGGVGAVVLVAGGLANVGLTTRDYFVRWSAIPEVRFVWQGDLDAVAGWLDDHPDVTSATVGGLSTTTMDAPSLDLLMQRDDVSVRWCDPGSPLGAGGGLVLPGDGGPVLVPTVVPLSDALSSYLGEGRGGGAPNIGSFRLYQPAELTASGRSAAAFRGGISLLDVVVPDGTREAGAELALVSIWRVSDGPHPDLKIYVHAVDDQGNLVAQHDGLDCPARFWVTGDTVVQLHRIRLRPGVDAGHLSLRIGLYDRQTLTPYPLLDGRPYLDVGDLELSAK